jgi:hypothetical protein
MPHFAGNPLEKLKLRPGDADTTLDLRGMPRQAALEQLEQLLTAGPSAATGTCHIRFDPAAGDGRETLFQPVGRRLLQARRDGVLANCLPLSDGAGYFISFAN